MKTSTSRYRILADHEAARLFFGYHFSNDPVRVEECIGHLHRVGNDYDLTDDGFVRLCRCRFTPARKRARVAHILNMISYNQGRCGLPHRYAHVRVTRLEL